jgi:signal transduction histidine kinase
VSARVSGDDLLLRETLERSLLFSLVLSILLGSTCGLIVAGYVDRRVRNIAALAERIGNGALNERLPVKRSREAFEELSRAINAMLDRIGSLLNELRMLTDALAHDLRSPVGRLRAAADRALTANRTEVQEFLLPRIVREADDLMRLLTTVLEIGKSDSLASRKQFSWFDAAQLGAEMTEMYEPLVEEAGCSIHFEQLGRDFLFHGHRQLLAQALSNMVENAIKYAAEGHEIRLFATRDMDSLRIGVADLGPGIPEEQMAQARRRFGRLDASRSKPGAGLGLALIESVANLHSGRLELANRYPGLLVTLVFQMPHPK